MPTKSELVSKIEELIGGRLSSLDRMTKDDLEKLYLVLSDPKSLLKMGLRSRRGEIQSISESIGLPKPPVDLNEVSEALGDPLKGLSLLLEITKKLEKRS